MESVALAVSVTVPSPHLDAALATGDWPLVTIVTFIVSEIDVQPWDATLTV
jgi:hypothetical protein